MAHHFTPQDVVPTLRSDLTINRPPIGAGAEVIRVTPAGADEPYTMRGFEFSIARMLNGKRTVREVMANCERIGLPMDLRSLEGLVQQLETHGLIADGGHPGVGQEPPLRRARATWSPEIRELYREALRDAREGDLSSAARACEALLDVAPGTFEAIALKEWLDHERETRDSGIPFRSLLNAAEEAWRNEPLAEEIDVGDLTEAPVAPSPLVRPRLPRPSLTPFLIMAAGVAVLAAAIFVPLPRVALASAQVMPISTMKVTPAREGVVDEVLVREGESVARGEELVVFNTDDARIRLAEARGELEELRQPLRDDLGKTPQGGPLYGALMRAEDEVARAQDKLLEAQKANSGLKFDEGITQLEDEFATAMERRDEARRALDALIPNKAPEQMKLQAKQLEIEMLQNQIDDPVLRAPDAGVVRDLNVVPGQHVSATTELLKLEDTSKLLVTSTVTPRVAKLAKAGDPITLSFDGRQYKSVIDKVNAFEVTARVDNADQKLLTGSYGVNLEFKPRSLWQTF